MRIILSCTTTFERERLFYFTYQSLCQQSLKPDLFLINISQDSYLSDSGFDQVPEWLANNLQENIKINWVDNTGPYRKLIPAIELAKDDDVIITADDDVLYHEEWLENMIKSSGENPGHIIAGRGRSMKKNMFGYWQNYDNWDYISNKAVSKFILPIGCDGVLYKKSFFDLDFLLDESYLDICPKTDDLWFKMASLRKETPVLFDPKIAEENIYLKHDQGLQNENVGREMNRNILVKKALSLPVLRNIKRLGIRCKDYLGINRSNNDINWYAIYDYHKSIDV